MAARTAVDQIINLHMTLMYLGVPIKPKSYMFGYNKAVVTNATIPTSTLSKRSHHAAYHRVQEAIAAGYLQFHWKDDKSNPADILCKHWGFTTIWPLLRPFFSGEEILQTLPPNQWGVTGFQPHIPKSEGSWFDSGPSSCNGKRVPKGNPRFYPNPTIFNAQNSLEWPATSHSSLNSTTQI